jgi:hypothetical protein
MVMTIVMTIVMTMVMSIVIVMEIIKTEMIGTLPFPKQQYTPPEEGASEAIVNLQK